MLSINTADLKQLSGSEKLSEHLRNVRQTQVTFRSADRHHHHSLPGGGFTAGTLETPRIFSEWANESNIYMQQQQQQQQLLRNVRLVQATFRSAGRHIHLSLPGCGFTEGTLEIPRIFF